MNSKGRYINVDIDILVLNIIKSYTLLYILIRFYVQLRSYRALFNLKSIKCANSPDCSLLFKFVTSEPPLMYIY